MLELYETTGHAESEPDEQAIMSEDPKLLEEHPIEGMLESALTINRTNQKGVRGTLGERLADDYLVIALGKKPEGTGRAIAFLLAALAFLALSGWSLLRRRAIPLDEPAVEQET